MFREGYFAITYSKTFIFCHGNILHFAPCFVYAKKNGDICCKTILIAVQKVKNNVCFKELFLSGHKWGTKYRIQFGVSKLGTAYTY